MMIKQNLNEKSTNQKNKTNFSLTKKSNYANKFRSQNKKKRK